MEQASYVKFATIACAQLRLGLILPDQFRGGPKIDDTVQLPFGELPLQLVSNCAKPLIFDGRGSQFVLIVNEIKIEDRDRLEFCAMRWRVKKPQHSAQHGRKNKPGTCCGNDGTQALRDEYVRNEQIADHLTLLSRRNGEQLTTETAAVNADKARGNHLPWELGPTGYAYTRAQFKPGSVARRFAYPCIALHSTAMAKVRGRRKQLMMQ